MCKINCSGGCPDCSPEDHPKPHKHADLIKAWADGAKIEYYSECENAWCTAGHNGPVWRLNTQYRIKPELKPDMVSVSYVHPVGNRVGSYHVRQSGTPENACRFTFDGETGKLKKVELL